MFAYKLYVCKEAFYTYKIYALYIFLKKLYTPFYVHVCAAILREERGFNNNIHFIKNSIY